MYFITMIQIKNNEEEDRRCVGYFDNFNEAEHVIINNICDLNETIYNYGLIENIKSGLYQYDENPIWYKFDEKSNKYFKCDRPKGFENYTGFAIG